MVNGHISLNEFKENIDEYMILVNQDKLKFEIATESVKSVILPAEQYYEMIEIIRSIANISK